MLNLILIYYFEKIKHTRKHILMKKILIAYLSIAIVLLSGCTAQPLSMMDVRTSMSDTIFVDPQGEKTVFVQLKNTTGIDDFSAETQVKTALEQKGYTITSRAQDAYFIVQANILRVEFFKNGRDDALQTLFGALLGAGLGAGIGQASGGHWGAGAAIGGLAGGIAGAALRADEMAFFRLTTNVQISEKSSQPVEVLGDQDYRPSLKQGRYGWKTSKYSHTTNLKASQTDIYNDTTRATTLKMATPELISQLSKSIAGIL